LNKQKPASLQSIESLDFLLEFTGMRSLCALACFVAVSAKLDFLVMGDWGGSEDKPYTTGGELGCGKQMGSLTPLVDAKFALALGDNFYYHGVPGDSHGTKSANNVNTK
jgi:hypothetical protein